MLNLAQSMHHIITADAPFFFLIALLHQTSHLLLANKRDWLGTLTLYMCRMVSVCHRALFSGTPTSQNYSLSISSRLAANAVTGSPYLSSVMGDAKTLQRVCLHTQHTVVSPGSVSCSACQLYNLCVLVYVTATYQPLQPRGPDRRFRWLGLVPKFNGDCLVQRYVYGKIFIKIRSVFKCPYLKEMLKNPDSFKKIPGSRCG